MGDSISIYRWIVSGISLVALKFAVDKALSIRTSFAKIKDYPGYLPLWVHPLGAIALVLGPTFPRPGMCGYYAGKFSLYKKFGATSFASVGLDTAQPFFWLADPDAIKAVTSDRFTFQKDVILYDIMNIYGGNLISTEGADWKRHRSIAMSAFNEVNVALVWSEALRVMNEWFEQLDAAGRETTVDLLLPMKQAILLMITAASFGRRVSWGEDSTAEPPPGCKLTFRSAVMNSVSNIVFRALVPVWFYSFSSLIKIPYFSSRASLAQLAFGDLRIQMLDLVSSARAEIASGKRSSTSALLRNLVEANMNHGLDSKKLTEEELLSDIFAFLVAGHETSAHTVCFALVFLAIYPECQQKIYEEVTRVWPEDDLFTQLATNHKEFMDKLEYTIACIRETLRMLPAEPRLSKDVHADSVLPGTYFTAGSSERSFVEIGKFSMAVPKGSVVVLDIWALHMNPLYWGDDPSVFRPERFIDTPSYQWPRHAYLPFSGGARSCIGQRFALAETIGILASVVHRYQIHVPDDVVHKPFEEQQETLLKWTARITLTPVNARVKLCRR